jgi:two-component system cell cycle sensor histidine kinase/response regulator CckA
MKVETEPGAGTRFTLIFPASYEPARRPENGVAAHVGRMSGTVLVVDDDDDVRRLTARMLESIGFGVVSVVCGAEALTAFSERADEFAFVLLDLMMPGMSGDQVIGELRRIRKTTPIILSSGYNSRELSERFVGHGITAFLQKPYQLAQLKATAANMLAYRAQQAGRDG